MMTLWHYYWVAVAMGVAFGAVTGTLLYNRLVTNARDQLAGRDTAIDSDAGKRRKIFLAGLVATIAFAMVWHLFAAERLAAKVEATVRAELKHQEMLGVSARLERSPLRRRIVLSGRADDFQHAELARIVDDLPGVSGVRWATPPVLSESVK
jgi:hypothetical protein